jgi:hypothetical protein
MEICGAVPSDSGCCGGRGIRVQGVRFAVNHDDRIRVFYELVKHRRGDQKATIPVANKMLKIIWYVLTRWEPYQSRNDKRYQQKLNSIID